MVFSSFVQQYPDWDRDRPSGFACGEDLKGNSIRFVPLWKWLQVGYL